MKKILAIAMTIAMILSMGVVFAGAAEYHPGTSVNPTLTPGAYASGDADSFAPVGDVNMVWVADAQSKITIDGKLEEWGDYASSAVTVTPNNMISWVGHDGKPDTNGVGNPDSTMPEGWQMTAYFLADPTYMWVGFYITDPDVIAASEADVTGGNYHAGDCFQINIDFGKKLGDALKNDPELVDLVGNPQNVFYSFAYAGDGVATVIKRDSSEDNRVLNSDAPYLFGDAEDNIDGTQRDDVVAYTAKTEEGWSAEFRIPWQLMYDDYASKAWLDNIGDSKIYIGGDDKKPLQMGMALYYLNNSTKDDGNVAVNDWAAGTGNGILYEGKDCPAVGWDAYDNGITLNLEADPSAGIEFTSPNIHVMIEGETEPPTEEETDAPTEEETDAPTEKETEKATEATGTTAGTDAATDAKTEAPKDDEGCASVIGMGAVAVLAAAAAAVVLKKKD